MKSFNDYRLGKLIDKMGIDSEDIQNESLGIMSFKITKGISDLLRSFGLSREEDAYKEIYIELEKRLKELLKERGLTVI